MSILDTFFILFEGDTSKLDKGLGEADKKAEGLKAKLHGVDEMAGKTGAGFMELMKRAAGVAGIGLSVGMLVKGVQETAKSYQQLGLLAARFRSTEADIHNFREESKLLGISEEQAVGGLTALSNAMQDTAMGMGRSQKVFRELHINVKDVHGQMKSTTAVLGELQKKLAGMDRGKQIRIMERLGLDPALLKMFNTDMVALRARVEDIDRATGFNLQTAVRRSQEYTKASKAMGVELNLLKMFLGKMSESLKLAAMPYFTQAMTLATQYMHKFTDYLVKHAPFVQGVFAAIGAAIAAYLIPSAISGAIAVWAMMAPFLAVGAVVVGLGALFALLYDDVMNFLHGDDSLIGSMLKKWPLIGEVIGDVIAVLKFLAEVIGDVARIVGTELGNAFGYLADKAGEALGWIEGKFADVAKFFRENFGGVIEFFSEAGQSITNVIQGWIDAVVAFIDKFGGIIGIAKTVAGAIRSVLGHAKHELDIKDGNTQAPPQPGTLPPGTAAAVAAGKAQLHTASTSHLTSTTSNSIAHGARHVKGGDRNVSVGKIEIQTQATDADGIARGIGGALGSHLRNANSQFDDGVAA